MTPADEVRELYRLIEAHCDLLIKGLTGPLSREAGRNLRSRARHLKDRTGEYTANPLTGDTDGTG